LTGRAEEGRVEEETSPEREGPIKINDIEREKAVKAGMSETGKGTITRGGTNKNVPPREGVSLKSEKNSRTARGRIWGSPSLKEFRLKAGMGGGWRKNHSKK